MDVGVDVFPLDEVDVFPPVVVVVVGVPVVDVSLESSPLVVWVVEVSLIGLVVGLLGNRKLQLERVSAIIGIKNFVTVFID